LDIRDRHQSAKYKQGLLLSEWELMQSKKNSSIETNTFRPASVDDWTTKNEGSSTTTVQKKKLPMC
jgi:hypothetical protein